MIRSLLRREPRYWRQLMRGLSVSSSGRAILSRTKGSAADWSPSCRLGFSASARPIEHAKALAQTDRRSIGSRGPTSRLCMILTVGGAEHPPHCEMLSVRLSKARGLNVALAAYALARLGVLEHRILSINLVLSLEVVGVGGGPAAIQGRSDVVVFHLDPTSQRPVRACGTGKGPLQRLQLAQHCRQQLRNSGMDVHR